MSYQTQQKTIDSDEDYLLCAAIDFGTTFSGYAFSTKNDYESNPLKVCCKVWTTGTGCLLSQKTSTCVLFDKSKKFHSFGFEAEDKYSDLSFDGEHKLWYFFRRFKMTLFDKMQLKKKFMLEDEMGKKLPALDVFSECIAYMKRQLMADIRKQIPVNVLDTEIRWVITVPAIWNDNSKQFMREATEKALIPGDRLTIALEPEAASLCCRFLPLDTFQGCGSGGVSPFAPGSKYLVFDAGGGTVDITVHQVEKSGGLKELYKANGGSWGGTYVDQAFRDLLTNIVGNDIFAEFTEDKTSDHIDLFREFEVKKRNFKNSMEEKITFRVPMALSSIFKDRNGRELKDHLGNSEYKGKINWIGDKLRMDAATAKGLFRDACESITKHLRELFRDDRVKDVPTILMVGGFSESPMLQEILKKEFPKKKIIIPSDASLAVLKGAVIYGHDPSLIEERKCKFTYGVQTSIPFDPKQHPEAKKFKNDKKEDYCADIFDRHVVIGQPVVCGETQVKRSYVPTRADQKQVAFKIFASPETCPTFVTDSLCKQLGTLTIDLEGSGMDRSVEVGLCFSGTEIKVVAEEKKTGKKKECKVNFLG